MSEDLQNVVKGIVGMLVRNDYERLASHTNGIRLNAAEIARAVADYGRTLVEPPADGYRLARVVAIKPAKFPAWSVTSVPLSPETSPFLWSAPVSAICRGSL